MKITQHLTVTALTLALGAGALGGLASPAQASVHGGHGGGGSSHGGGGGGHWNGGGHWGGGWGGGGWGRSGVRIGIGFGTGFGCYGGSYCGSYSYYPRYYGGYYRSYAPVVIASPYYGYYGSSYAYDYPSTVVVSQPVATQPVVIQQPVAVASAPAYDQTQAGAYPQQAYQPQTYQQQTYQPAPAASAPAPQPPQTYPTQQQQQTAQNRFQDRELGDAYMRMHDPDNAARVYSRYLATFSTDAAATRNFGLARIARGETQEGFRMVVQGYKMDAGLIKQPLRVADLGGKIGFERILDAASVGAAGSNSAEGWATVALLQHSSGNHEAAVIALQKARDAGLDQTTLDEFTLEIGKPNS